jgi:Protein of unknown function (DUF2845)
VSPRVPVLAAGLLAAVVAGGAGSVRAESLRCHGHSAAEGDSRLSVLYKCGEPVLRDSFCAPVAVPGRWHPVQPLPWVAGPAVVSGAPCLPVEEWLYDRGAGHLMAVVRFQGGVDPVRARAALTTSLQQRWIADRRCDQDGVALDAWHAGRATLRT